MAENRIATTVAQGYRRLGMRGQPLIAVHSQLAQILRNRLGREHAELFARPNLDPTSGSIEWFTSRAGEPHVAATLDAEHRAGIEALTEQLMREVEQLADKLGREGDTAELASQMLRGALQRPPGDWLYEVDGKPVLIMWGHVPESGATPSSGVLPPHAAAPAAAAATTVPAAATVTAADTGAAAATIGSAAVGSALLRRWWWLWLLLLALILLTLLRWWLPVRPLTIDMTGQAPASTAAIDAALARQRALQDELLRQRQGKIEPPPGECVRLGPDGQVAVVPPGGDTTTVLPGSAGTSTVVTGPGGGGSTVVTGPGSDASVTGGPVPGTAVAGRDALPGQPGGDNANGNADKAGPAKSDTLAAGKDGLPPTGQDAPPPGKDLPATGKDFPPTGKDLPPNVKDLPPTGKDLPPNAKDLPPAGKDLPDTGKDGLPPTGKDGLPPTGKDDLPPGKDGLPPTGKDGVPPVGKDGPAPDGKGSPANDAPRKLPPVAFGPSGPVDPSKLPQLPPPQTDKPLTIPPDTPRNGVPDFMRGTWSASPLQDEKTKKPLNLSLVLGDQGKGQLVIRREDGSTCMHPVTAGMRDGKLAVEAAGEMQCSDGSTGRPTTRFECVRNERGRTLCSGQNPSGSAYEMDIYRGQAQ